VTQRISQLKFALSESALQDLGYYIVYLVTPWGRVLLEKLIVAQLVKKLQAFHGNRRFIAVFTKARHRSLS
jgi:hypothetical protein